MIDPKNNGIFRKGATVLVVTATLASLAAGTAATMGIQSAKADDNASQETQTDTFKRNFVANSTAVVSKGAGQAENKVQVDANGDLKSDLGAATKDGYLRVTLDKARTTLTDFTFTLNDGINAKGTVQFLDADGHTISGADVPFDTTNGTNVTGQKITINIPSYVLAKGAAKVAVNMHDATNNDSANHTVGFKHVEVNGTYKVAQSYLIKDAEGKDIAGTTLDTLENGKAQFHTGDTTKVYVKTPTEDVEQDFTMDATNGATVVKGAVVNDEKSPVNGYTEFTVTLNKPGQTVLKVTSPSDKNAKKYETDVTLKAYDLVSGIDHIFQMPQHVVSGDHASIYANVSPETALQTTKWEIADGASHASITPNDKDSQYATLVGGAVTESTRITVRAVALDTLADPSKPSTDEVNKDAKYTEYEFFIDAPEVKDGAAVAGVDTDRARVGEADQTLNLVDAEGNDVTRTDTKWSIKSGGHKYADIDDNGDGTANLAFKQSGKITVTASVDGKTFTRDITVLKAAPSKASLRLDKSDAFVGETVKGTVTYSNPDYKDLDTTTTWTSSDPTVATVDNAGNVKVLKAGKVTITATGALGKAQDSATLNTWVRPTAVTVTPSDANFDGWLTLPDETTTTLNATAVDATGSSTGVKQGVTWKSSNDKVASVDANGVVTAHKAGHVKITATSTADAKAVGSYNLSVDGKAAPVTVTVKNSSTSAFKVGDTRQLLAYDQDGELTPVTWTSSDEKVATVDANGLVTAVAPGKVTLTATYSKDGKETKALKLALLAEDGTPASGAIELEVVAKDAIVDPSKPDTPVAPTSVNVNAAGYNEKDGIKVGDTLDLSATDQDGKTLDGLTWTSSDDTIATVKGGVVTGVKAGNVTITATYGTGENAVSGTFNVKVAAASSKPGDNNTNKPGDGSGDETAKTHTVTLDYGHDDLKGTFKVKDGDTLATDNADAAKDPALTGYKFAGWTVDGGDSGKTVDLSQYKVTEDVTFLAHWSKADATNNTDNTNKTNANNSTKDADKTVNAAANDNLAKTGATVGVIAAITAALTAAGVGLRKFSSRKD